MNSKGDQNESMEQPVDRHMGVLCHAADSEPLFRCQAQPGRPRCLGNVHDFDRFV